MAPDLIREVVETFSGKQYLILGTDGESYIIMDMATNNIKVLPKQTVLTLAPKLANAKVVNNVIEVEDISKSRLASIFEGDIFNFSYIVRRYRDAHDFTLGYLVYIFTNKNTVQLVKLSTVDALKTFEHGVVLNAKKVTRGGQEIIAGIVKPLPEFNLQAELVPRNKKPNAQDAHEKYLDKAESYFERNFVSGGFSVGMPNTNDSKKRIQRYVVERIKKNAPELFEWFNQQPSMRRAIQTIDAYMAKRYEEGKLSRLTLTARRSNWKSGNHLDNKVQQSNIILIHSPITSGVDTLEYSPDKVYKSGQTVITTSLDGVIALTDASAIKNVQALKEGVTTGEIQIFFLDGALSSDTESLPLTDGVKKFLILRDKMVCSLTQRDVIDTVKKVNGYDTVFRNVVYKIKGLPGYKKADSEKKRTYRNSLNIEQTDWSSSLAFHAFKYTDLDDTFPTGETKESETSNVLKQTTFYSNRNYRAVDIYKLMGESIQYVKYVGDVVLANSIMNGMNHTESETVMAKVIALLILGNKPLAKDLLQRGYIDNDTYNIDETIIDSAQISPTIAYRTGGRVGDADNIIEYNKRISFANHSNLRYETAMAIKSVMDVIYPQHRLSVEKIQEGVYKE